MAGLVLALGGQAEAKDRCAFKGSKTLRQTSKLRLYVIASSGLSDRFYVCVRSNGRRFRADDRTSQEVTMQKRSLTSSGSFAAVAYDSYQNEDAAGLNVVVIDLRTGKQRVHVENPDEFSVPTVPSIVLRSTGAAAWVYEQKPISSSEGTRKREVHAAGTGSIRTLDSGLDIDPASLALDGATVSWTNAGVRKTATLS
ncbi:MAG: hypothetical protein QOH13_728 [Thermoleophilaceae bacterium]|nr:hypothetical protein [Thermoleophilaceae bacterium]